MLSTAAAGPGGQRTAHGFERTLSVTWAARQTEYFEEGRPDKVLHYNDPGDWHGHYNEWLSLVDTEPSLGKDFIGRGHGIATDTDKMTYTKAAFLLKWNGANSKFTAPRTFTGGAACNNATFGDRALGACKWCETRPLRRR